MVRRIHVGPRPTGLRAAAGAIWVGFGRAASSIVRVDPKTRAFQRILVGVRAPSWFVAGTRDLWVQAADHVLVRLDASSRRVRARLSFGRTLAQGALGPDGMLWVPTRSRASSTGSTRRRLAWSARLPRALGAFFALRAYGSMWVASDAGDDVWRFAP